MVRSNGLDHVMVRLLEILFALESLQDVASDLLCIGPRILLSHGAYARQR